MKGLKLPKKFKKFKPFAQQLEDGDICDLPTASKLVGYSEQHLRRLCADKEDPLPHIRRNKTQLYFEPKHIAAVFERRGESVGSTQ